MLENQIENLTNEIKALQKIMSSFSEVSFGKPTATITKLKPTLNETSDVEVLACEITPSESLPSKKHTVQELNEYIMAHVRRDPSNNRPFVFSVLKKHGCVTLTQAEAKGELDSVAVELKKEFENAK